MLDTQVIQNGSVLRTAVLFFYLSNEGISIIENVALIGLPVPKKLKEVLEQLHEEADEKKEDEMCIRDRLCAYRLYAEFRHDYHQCSGGG